LTICSNSGSSITDEADEPLVGAAVAVSDKTGAQVGSIVDTGTNENSAKSVPDPGTDLLLT